MSGISSINPTTPKSPERQTRQGLAAEILGNPEVDQAIRYGVLQYKVELDSAVAAAKEIQYIEDARKTFINLDLITMALDNDYARQLPKRAESMRRSNRGTDVTQIVLGEPVLNDGIVRKQMQIRAEVENSDSTNEERISRSYRGQDPQNIVLNGATTNRIKFSISMLDAQYIERTDENGNPSRGVQVTESSGITLCLDGNGNINEIQGLTFKHGMGHNTTNLIPQDAPEEFKVDSETIASIRQFAE